MANNAFDTSQQSDWTTPGWDVASLAGTTTGGQAAPASSSSFSAPASTSVQPTGGTGVAAQTAPGMGAANAIETTGVAPVPTAGATTQASTTGRTTPAPYGSDLNLASGVYGDLIAATKTGTPEQKNVAMDTLARTIQTNLTNAGHVVEWAENGQLIVDGRHYNVAGGVHPTTAATDPNKQARTVQDILAGIDKNNWAAGLKAAQAELEKLGYKLQVDSGGNIRGRIFRPDGSAWDPFNEYGWVTNGSGGGGGVGGTGIPGDGSGWLDRTGTYTPTSGTSTYTPTSAAAKGTITDAINNIAGQSYTGTHFSDVNPGLDKLTKWLEDNPMSMGPNVVEQMKAADAEEQMLAAQSADQAMQRFGGATGQMSSPWLASERGASARDYDASIIANRRNIDIKAAETNTADMRNAISTLNTVWNTKKDIHALNETIDQFAASFGMNRDQFVAQLQMRLLELEQSDNQFGARLDLDWSALNQNDRQFGSRMDLDWSALDQNDRQFGSRMGLDWALANKQ